MACGESYYIFDKLPVFWRAVNEVCEHFDPRFVLRISFGCNNHFSGVDMSY